MNSDTPSGSPDTVDRMTQVKGVADTASSVLGAVTGTATLLGLIWVVLEAFFLPDGLPRLDAASFATLASAIAVAAVLIIAYCSTAVGAAGFVFRRWRRTSLEKYARPFHKETPVETAQFLTLFVATSIVVIAATTRRDLSPWIVVGVPAVATVVAVCLTAAMDPRRRPDVSRDLTMIYSSLVSSVVWFPAVLVFSVLTLGSGAVGATGNLALDLGIYVVFLLAAAVTNYIAAVAKPGIALVVGIAITTVAGILNPQMILGAPFRALQLIDTTVHFPPPVAASDRITLETLSKPCDSKVFVRLPDGTFEVTVRKRIGLDWTVNCNVGGETVTFPRGLISGMMPLVSPSPMPVRTRR